MERKGVHLHVYSLLECVEGGRGIYVYRKVRVLLHVNKFVLSP